MKNRVATSMITLLLATAFAACDSGKDAVIPSDQKVVYVNRNIYGDEDLRIALSAREATLISAGSATSLTLHCPCYFGNQRKNDERWAGGVLVLEEGAITLRILPGANYYITTPTRIIETSR